MRVAGLLLAAGAGTRLGRPKALLRLGNQTLAERMTEVLAEGGCDPVVVVLGAGAEEARARIIPDNAATPRVSATLSRITREILINADWATGMGSSLAAGLRALPEQDAVVVALVDQPGISPEAVRRLVELADPEALAAAAYHGRRGHPVLFGRNHWDGIMAMAKGDMGARAYLKERDVRLVECADVASDDDIDTPEAAHAWGIE